MESILYSDFRNHLKDYMKKVNDEFETLVVVNKNPEEDIVVLSNSEWDSLKETIAVGRNNYLSQKV
ncbi:type II toxin-antitoxin system Phd/YefM family antitoxin, partial [Streptococcus suis]